jgi:hypothetical protein
VTKLAGADGCGARSEKLHRPIFRSDADRRRHGKFRQPQHRASRASNKYRLTVFRLIPSWCAIRARRPLERLPDVAGLRLPPRPRSVGFLPLSWPPRGRYRGGVQGGPVPVDAIGLGQLFEQHLVRATPDACFVPVPQPPPARHPAPTAHLSRQVLPGNTGLQHEQDPVSAARSDTRGRPPFGFGASGGMSGAIRNRNASGNSSTFVR